MRNAVILDYEDGTIVLLPIPDNIPADKEEDFVQMNDAFNSDTCAYMLTEGDIDIWKVKGDAEFVLYDTIPENLNNQIV